MLSFTARWRHYWKRILSNNFSPVGLSSVLTARRKLDKYTAIFPKCSFFNLYLSDPLVNVYATLPYLLRVTCITFSYSVYYSVSTNTRFLLCKIVFSLFYIKTNGFLLTTYRLTCFRRYFGACVGKYCYCIIFSFLLRIYFPLLYTVLWVMIVQCFNTVVVRKILQLQFLEREK